MRLVLMCLVLAACGKNEKASVTPAAVWTNENHEICEVKLHQDLTSLPFDIAINTNRFDLMRYDALASSRGFVVRSNLEIVRAFEGALDPAKPGQVGSYIGGFSNGKAIMAVTWAEPEHAVSLLLNKKDELEFSPKFYKSDVYSRDISTNELLNLTDDNFGYYNFGISIYAGMPGKIAYTSFINGESRPLSMNLDGTSKQQLVNTTGFAYGLSVSPDGTKYAFHGSTYKVYIGDIATGVETKVETPCSFNFAPVWSPDSQLIAFTCGSDIWTAKRDGTDSQFLASRNGYGNGVNFTKAYDPHGGGSDAMSWLGDSSGVVHGVMSGDAVQQAASYLNGTQEMLTNSAPGTRNVYPNVSPDGNWLMFNSNRGTKQDVYLLNLNTREEIQVTDLKADCHTRLSQWNN